MPSSAARRSRQVLGTLVFVAFTLIVAIAAHLRLLATGRANGLPLDSDGWVRMIRVRELWNGGGWYDHVLPHLFAPEGLDVHWTRPLDVLIIVPAWIATLFGADGPEALQWSGSLVCPVLHALTALAAGWAARRAWPDLRYAAYYAVLVLFTYEVLSAYSAIGRADHHVLVVLAIVLGLGAAAKAAWLEAPPRAAYGAGAAFGFGIWVSPEALLAALPALGAFGVGWLLSARGRRWALQGLRMATGLFVMVALAIVVERPPAGWADVEYDKVSVHHLLLAALVALVFAAAARMDTPRLLRRLMGGTAAFVAAALVLVLVNPGTLGFSLSGADVASAALLLPSVQEMQPIRLTSLGGLAGALEFAGMAPAALIAAAVLTWRGRRDGNWVRGFVLLATVAAATVATLMYRRLGADLAGIGAVAASGLIGMAAQAPWPVLVRAPLMLGAMVLIFTPPQFGPALLQRASPEVTAAGIAPQGCHARDLTNWMLSLAPAGDRRTAPIVLSSDINQNAELAWRTHLRYVGGPYHRRALPLADTLTLFGAEDQATLDMILQRREPAYLLVCPNTYAGTGAFAMRLLRGDVPDWLEPVPPPPGQEAGQARLFRVRERPAPASPGG